MKWTRNEIDENREMSTGYIGLRHYITISHTSYNNHYWYTYSVNGERVLDGQFEAESWYEAEQIVMLKIRNKLSLQAEMWNKRLAAFDKGVIESETLG
jgi:hypothetical protein